MTAGFGRRFGVKNIMLKFHLYILKLIIISYFMFKMLINSNLVFLKNEPHRYKNELILMYK